MYFDRDGDEIDLLRWAELHEDIEYKVLKQDQVDNWFISTVWIGIDFAVGLLHDEPLTFETMAFDNSPEGIAESEKHLNALGMKAFLGPEEYCRRYATEENALKGHREAVVAAEAGLIRRDAESRSEN